MQPLKTKSTGVRLLIWQLRPYLSACLQSSQLYKSLVVVIRILFEFNGFSVFAVVEGEVLPVRTGCLYNSIFQYVAENDGKLPVLNIHAQDVDQKKEFVFDGPLCGGYALLYVYCRAKSGAGVRGFALMSDGSGTEGSGGSRLGAEGLDGCIHWVKGY